MVHAHTHTHTHTHITLTLLPKSININGHNTYSCLPWFFSFNLVCKIPWCFTWKKIDSAVKKGLGNAGLHCVFNVHCDSLRSWYTIFSISQINLTWGALLKNISPIISALITNAGKFLYTYYSYLIAFSDIFSEGCFEHTACKIIFSSWKSAKLF